MKKLLFLFSVLLISAYGLPALAADEKQSEEPPRNEALEAAQDFMKDLDETSQRHFSVLHGNYNLIKVVETVRESVDEAVAACGKANPDMKEALGTRFGAWKEAVRPVMKEADANVENMILAQDYAKPKEIRSFLKMVDKARKKQRDAVERVPVVTPEACQNLLEKMDDTQENMIRLLKATLVSLPQVMQAQDDERRAKVQAEKEKAEAEAAAKAEAEAEAEKENAEKEAEEKGGE